MRILRTVVQIPAYPVPDILQHCSLSETIAAQAVSDEASWLASQPLQQLFEELPRSLRISAAQRKDVEHEATLERLSKSSLECVEADE
jgi:hypothetical protein